MTSLRHERCPGSSGRLFPHRSSPSWASLIESASWPFLSWVTWEAMTPVSREHRMLTGQLRSPTPREAYSQSEALHWQNLSGSRVASVINALICTPMCNLRVNNMQVFFASGNVNCLEAISTLSGYLIRWKFPRVQPINASIALAIRQSSFLKGFYNSQVKKKITFYFGLL